MEIKKICVLGAGLMGNGIAQICAQAGYQVMMRDIGQQFIDGGMRTITKNLVREVEKGKRTRADMETILSRIRPTLDMKEAAADADVVVEVVIEVMDVKKKGLSGIGDDCSGPLPLFYQHVGVKHHRDGGHHETSGSLHRNALF